MRHAGNDAASWVARVVLPLPGSPVSTTSRPMSLDTDVLNPSCNAEASAVGASVNL
jgi:hypothetical protein